MSPRFEPDLSKARASTRIFDRGEYEVQVTGLGPVEFGGENYIYSSERESGVVEVAGVRVELEMVGEIQADSSLDREFEGEDVAPARFYVHTEGAWPFAKRFLMAAAGFSREEEDEFDEEWVPDNPIFIDGDVDEPDTQELGPGWESIVGQNVQVTLDKEMSDDGERVFQSHNAWQPVS